MTQAYDTVLGDPAFATGSEATGDLEFEFNAPGPHLVEIFVANPEAERFPFRLESTPGGLLAEQPLIAPGPGRMRPKRGLRHTSLVAVVDGPRRLFLRTAAPRYTLSAARWTAMDRFEREVVPKLLDRARFLHANILTEAARQRPTSRSTYLRQLGDRLYHSRRGEVRQEGLLYRLRGWFWLTAENHEPDDILQTHLLLEEARRRMPSHPIVRQMISASCSGQIVRLGRMPSGSYCEGAEPVVWTVDVPAPPEGAPAWAAGQRRLARRMDAITRWWVDKRQAPNGELGGGWGDDVEILRHWGPQALGLGSEAAARGILRIAEGLWNSGTLRDGYNRGITDVEHSAEPTTDSQPLAAAIDPFNAAVRARLGQTAACSEYWIEGQPDGFLRFRSSWFNCREADTAPERAVDVHLNTRAMGPALWYAYLTREAKLTARIAGWADAWIHAMRASGHGKPAGVFPPAMRARDGAYLLGGSWDKPQAEWDYFQWSGEAQESLTSLVLAAYELTGEKKYRDAAAESFDILGHCSAHLEVCRAIVRSPEAFYHWRRITGDPRYDRVFSFKPQPPAGEILNAMARMAGETERRLARNWDMFTTEVLYTDRVYYPLPPEYRWRLFGGEAPRGDRYPTFAVTWPAAQAEFARVVLAASERGLRARLYSFEREEKFIPLRLWRLEPGAYRWRCGDAQGEFSADRLPHLLNVPLAPRREVTLSVEPATRRAAK